MIIRSKSDENIFFTKDTARNHKAINAKNEFLGKAVA
mgnify:CR=1 FL=1